MAKQQTAFSDANSAAGSDEELVLRLAAGGEEALGSLYARYAQLIFNMAARALDRSAAEEIVQDVLLTVWRRADSYDPERGPVRPWLLQIARRRILNELRHRSRLPQADPDREGLRLLSLPDPDPDPADVAWRQEHRAAVRAAVGGLPPLQREAVDLAFFGELTHQEVAAKLQVPLGTAKTRIRTGLQRLRPALASLTAAAVLLLGGLLAALGLRFHAEQQRQQREGRALALVTSSETTSVHLSPAAGVPEAAHGNYRGQAGRTTATLNVSHLPPAPAGHHYQAWARFGGAWVSLGSPHLDMTGDAMLILEGQQFTTVPDAVEVTIESGAGHAPSGPPVISWQAEPPTPAP